MKIASVIKHRDGSPRCVHIHGQLYEFKPVKDKDEVTHFIADVIDPEHAALFMANEAFYAFDGKPPAAALKRAAPAPVNMGADGGAASPVASLSDAQLTAALELLKGSAGDIGKAVGNATLDTVRSAIAVESASKTPRKSVIGLLQTALDGAIAAGVKG